MSNDLQKMAREYRTSSAKLAMRLRQLEREGGDPERIRLLREMLRSTREAQDAVSGYYTAPRQFGGLTCSGWTGNRARGDK